MGLLTKLKLPPVPVGKGVGTGDGKGGKLPVAPPLTKGPKPPKSPDGTPKPLPKPPLMPRLPTAVKPEAGGSGGTPAPQIGGARAAEIEKREKAYRDAFAAMKADYDAAVAVRALSPQPATGASVKKWDDAEKARSDGEAKSDWLAAIGALSVLKIAARELIKARSDKATYDTEFAKLVTDWNAAKAFMDIEIFARHKVAMLAGWARVQKAVDAKNWTLATSLIPPVQTVAKKLAAEGATYDGGRKPFEAEYAKLTNIEAAKAIAAAAPKGIAKAAESFTNRYNAVNDARNAGDFDTATKGLPLLQAAASQLLIAKEGDDQKRLLFVAAFNEVPQYALVVTLAASPPPDLAAKAAPFKAADKAVANKRNAGDWDAAKAAVPALRAAAEALVEAKAAFNEKLSPEAIDAFNKKIAALKPRTDKALDSPVPAFVVPLQKAVLTRITGIQDLVAAKDFAGAELGHTKLLDEIAAMEKAKRDFAAFEAALKTAKDGEIKKAMAVDLKVPGLINARQKAMTKDEASIRAAADRGSFGVAERKIKAWIEESKAWAGAKDAYDSLHSGGTPDEGKLKALAAQPGGGGVLDDLVADLPDNSSTKVLGVALKARFGIAVKRFAAPLNSDEADLTGQTELNKNLPDKSLKKVYEVLGKVPDARLKGKVTDLIQYDADKGGAMYDLNKKIYMYCGRSEDPGAGKQKFSVDGEIMPKGEKVDESCKPVDDKELPYFDFALLHEAGHAEDDAAKFMEKRFGNEAFGGWKVDNTPDAAATAAAAHFKYDRATILAMLKAKGSPLPPVLPKPPKGVDQAEWDKRRDDAAKWCQSVRVEIGLWWKAGLSKQVAINGRVYQEGYDNYWVSYSYAARSQGLTGYQFRSHMEWFAELYAGFFSKKLKPNHPAAAWLQQFKPPKG